MLSSLLLAHSSISIKKSKRLKRKMKKIILHPDIQHRGPYPEFGVESKPHLETVDAEYVLLKLGQFHVTKCSVLEYGQKPSLAKLSFSYIVSLGGFTCKTSITNFNLKQL